MRLAFDFIRKQISPGSLGLAVFLLRRRWLLFWTTTQCTFYLNERVAGSKVIFCLETLYYRRSRSAKPSLMDFWHYAVTSCMPTVSQVSQSNCRHILSINSKFSKSSKNEKAFAFPILPKHIRILRWQANICITRVYTTGALQVHNNLPFPSQL